ncbi:queuosine salvage protein [Trichonephila clavata]|uniref:Queuosine 5'-phosphate N-glycosylase/hydrolase n=1 Tax=Trichonephila clavata TaxID=2740835 RepID=A0A8X6LDF5_TRICU|nr:queuosine salvage protein [Trichonephila clavata]
MYSQKIVSPRQSADCIAKLAKHVTIPQEGVEKASELYLKNAQDKRFTLSGWWKSHELNPKDQTSPSTLDWVFLADTLNFSFWAEKGKPYEITFEGKTYTGYWSLCAAMNRAIKIVLKDICSGMPKLGNFYFNFGFECDSHEFQDQSLISKCRQCFHHYKEGYNITSPTFYADVSLETLKHIFRSDSGREIPLLNERHQVLQETGKCLIEKFDSSFATCVTMAKNSAQSLLKIVLENFSSYRDEATIEGQHVTFYKRAQILIADIWLCFESKGYGAFDDIDTLTIFADYRVPQALAYLGALKYSEEFEMKLKSDELLPNGDRYEVEIRGCSIKACELICQYIKQKQKEGTVPQTVPVNSILVDNFLWEYRRNNAKEMEHIPFHKTRCIYY